MSKGEELELEAVLKAKKKFEEELRREQSNERDKPVR